MTREIFPRDIAKNATSLLKPQKIITDYKEKLNVYSDEPVHDWSSDTMDAFRYLAVIQSKKRNKGMTEEEAEYMQAMYQFRHYA